MENVHYVKASIIMEIAASLLHKLLQTEIYLKVVKIVFL